MLLLLLLLGVACTGDEPAEDAATFVLPSTDLGVPRAAATGFDQADGDAVGRALDATLPVFGAEIPLWEAPRFVWELLQRDTVGEAGVCPHPEVEGDGTSYVGDCRSASGYAFEGSLSERAWDEAAVAYERLDAEMVVRGDVAEPLFSEARLEGAILRAVPDDGRVDAHYDVNLSLALLGYFEQRDADDPRALSWSDWNVSGTVEERDGVWQSDLTVDVGGAGGMRIDAAGLTLSSTCPVEADGEAILGDGITAAFVAAGCDACADVAWTGGSGVACAP